MGQPRLCLDCGTGLPVKKGYASPRCDECRKKRRRDRSREYQRRWNATRTGRQWEPPPVNCVDCGADLPEQAKHGRRRYCGTCRARRRRQTDAASHRKKRAVDAGRPWVKEMRCRDCDVVLVQRPRTMTPQRCPDCGPAHAARAARRAAEKDRQRRFTRHGMTEATFNALLKRQGGRCAVCRSDSPGTRGHGWHIDHDHACCQGHHSCGACVRGLLCATCNVGIGYFRDDPELLRAAVDYLARNPPPLRLFG